MANLEVVFELPQQIEMGLASGAFERVGGVIVDSSSRQVIAWLRDGAALGDSVQEPAAGLFQGAGTLSMLAGLAGTAQVINLALTSTSLHAISRRVDRLSDEIKALKDVVQAEHARDRDMRFEIALQNARDALESQQVSFREGTGQDAISGLYEAKENLLEDVRDALNGAAPFEHLVAVQHDLIRAMYAQTSRIRCYMELGEPDLARDRVAEDMPEFEGAARSMIERWLGEHPALFLHKEIAREDVARFIKVQRWLHSESESDPGLPLAALDDLRADFWNAEIVQDEYGDFLGQITRRPARTLADRLEEMPDRLTQIEIVMENFRRLQGFEIELRSMRLSTDNFEEWQHLGQGESMGVIVNRQALGAAP